MNALDLPAGRHGTHAWLTRLCDRHGWICHLCGREIPRDVSSNHPMAASRDHVIPRSRRRGVPFNSLPAHRFCNSLRCSRPLHQVDADAYHRALLRTMARSA